MAVIVHNLCLTLYSLQADDSFATERQNGVPEVNSALWDVGPQPRDSFRAMVRVYLTHCLGTIPRSTITSHLTQRVHSLTAQQHGDQGLKWDPRKWPSIAAFHKLVLTGWGPDMSTLPTDGWVDKSRGALTSAQWKCLVSRIPIEYFNNPFHSMPEDELALEIVSLDDFLDTHAGTSCHSLSVRFSDYNSLSTRICGQTSLCCRPHWPCLVLC